MASAAFLCAPYESIPSKDDPKQRVAYLSRQKKLGDVIHYQSGFREVPVERGCVAYSCNRGKIDDFSLGESPGDSVARFVALWESYPGEYLATWTYGHAVHVLFLASRAEPPMREVSFRLACPPGGRDSHLVEGFCRWFGDTRIKPDLDQIRRELSSPEISVKSWFAAFGIEGASDLASGSEDIWKEFEHAALRLLRGDEVEQDLLDRINARIPDEDSHLTREFIDHPGATARLVHGAAFELAESFGEPTTPLWQQRYRAARFYWDITDCEDSSERLTVGIDEQGLGTSASLGRLLAHYPAPPWFEFLAGSEDLLSEPASSSDLEAVLPERSPALGICVEPSLPAIGPHADRPRIGVRGRPRPMRSLVAAPSRPVGLMRDPIFLAFAGMEAESANGHAFVEAFHCLAEAARSAGFSVAVFPEGLESKFRKAFGIESEWEEPRSAKAQGWSAEAFVDLPGLLTVDPVPAIEQWYAAEKADGLLVRAESDGAFRVIAFRDGERVDRVSAGFAHMDEEKISQAGRMLHPRGVFQALGLPDLLEPGQWQEGAYGGRKQDRTEELDEVARTLSDLPEPTRIGSFKELLGVFPREIRSHRSRVQGKEQPLGIRIVLPALDDTYRDLLMEDLGCRNLLESYGESRPGGSDTIWAVTYSDLSTRSLIRVLGDVPDGTSVACDLGLGKKFHYRLDKGRVTEELLFRACVHRESGQAGWDENPLQGIQVDHPAIEEIVFENGGRIYFRLDLAKMDTENVRESGELLNVLRTLGFVHLGDLVCDEFNMVVVRACIREDQMTYGAVLVPSSGSCYVEFVTYFEDWSSLTTTTFPNAKEDLARKKLVQIVAVAKGQNAGEGTVTELWRTHLARIERFRRAGTRPKPLDPTLLGMALALEASVAAEQRA